MTTQTETPVRRMRFAGLLCLFFGLATAAIVAEPVKRLYDLPSDTVEESLKRLSEQSGLEVLFPTNYARGLRTRRVRGEFTAREALDRMLAGTGLVGVQDEKSGALTVRRDPGPNARRAAQSDPNGRPPDQPQLARDGSDGVRVAAEKAKRADVVRASDIRGDTIELSPFEVMVDSDRGYYGANTLSGTRLNAKLEDLAASITVVNRRQIEDLAITNIDDLFLYEANTEGSGNFTDFDIDRDGIPQDGVDSITNPPGGNRVRGLGRANIARDGFSTNQWANTPLDTYNVDAVEISRGPNSNIFGVGDGSGTVNMVTSQARLDRSMSRGSVRVDSYGGWRSTIDLNRPLGRTLSFRVLGLYEEKAYKRKPSADDTKRITLATTFKPFKNTMIRASYETYRNFSRRPNNVTPVDFISEWIAAGRPTWDPTTFTAKLNGAPIGTFTTGQDGLLPAGLIGSISYNPVRYIDGFDHALWTVARLGNNANPNTLNSNIRFIETGTQFRKLRSTTLPLFRYKGFSDQSLYDWTSINAVSPNYTRTKTNVYRLDIEQFFLNTPTQVLAAKLGWFREDADKYYHIYFGGGQNSMSSFVMVDPNEKLLDGSPNPFFLRPYIRGGGPVARGRPEPTDTSRAQVAYQLDLTGQKNLLSWLGRHRVSGYGEFQEKEVQQRDMGERVLSDHSWVNVLNRGSGPAAGGNGTIYRYYLGDNQGQNIDYGPAPLDSLTGFHDFYWRDGATGVWHTETAQWGETPLGGTSRRTELRTQGLTLQSYFLGERIVTTFGWRHDKQRNMGASAWTQPPAVLAANPDLFPNGERRFLPEWNNPWVEKDGRTKTTGVVVRPFRGLKFLESRAAAGGFAGNLAEAVASLNLHYNESDSFVPADLQTNIMGEPLPNPFSVGKDYGFSFSLFDGRLYLKANKYETLTIGNRNNDARSLANAIRRIDRAGTDTNTGYTTFRQWAERIANERFSAQGIANPTEEQLNVALVDIMKLDLSAFGPNDSFNQFFEGTDFQSGLTGEVDNAASKGMEFELNYNPTRYWTLKMNVTKQEAINSDLSPAIQRFIALRKPVWETAVDDQGVSFWETSGAKGEFVGQEARLKLQIALQGLPRPQVRKWRANMATSYNFAGLGTERKWLKNLTVGGSARWEDQASIGFFGMPPEEDGVIRSLDATRPVFDKARAYFDGWARYNLRFRGDKIRASVQLNVRNMFEGGRLQVVGADPAGDPYAFRIIDPRQFILTFNVEL